MKLCSFGFIVLVVLTGVLQTKASQAGAQKIVEQHAAEMKRWGLQLRAAKTLQEVQKILKQKPDISVFRSQMIKQIGGNLSAEWSLRYSTWLIENANLGKKDTNYLFEFAKKHHLKSKDLARFCYAAVYANKPTHEKKKFLELALKNVTDPKQQGVINLSLAVLLRDLGDTEVNNNRRLSLLKNAVIESAEVVLGNVTVGDVAMEEVYMIKKLSKGKIAPDFLGKDSSGRNIKLSDYRGKAVILVFWSSWDISVEETRKMLSLLKEIEKQYIAKPFALLCVNRDWLENLKTMERDNALAGKTISDPQEQVFQKYRVKASPVCFVIDQSGKIRYHGQLGSFATLTVDSLLQPENKQSGLEDSKLIDVGN